MVVQAGRPVTLALLLCALLVVRAAPAGKLDKWKSKAKSGEEARQEAQAGGYGFRPDGTEVGAAAVRAPSVAVSVVDL